MTNELLFICSPDVKSNSFDWVQGNLERAWILRGIKGSDPPLIDRIDPIGSFDTEEWLWEGTAAHGQTAPRGIGLRIRLARGWPRRFTAG